MKIVIMGSGGVGGLFGSMLARSGDDVWFVARGNHLAAMRRNGLRVNMSGESSVVPPGKMTDNLRDIGAADVVLFCVKSYDTEEAASRLDPVLTDQSIVVSLQNGVDNETMLQKTISRGTVYGGVAYVYCTITEPGVLTEPGGPRKIVFGPLSPSGDRNSAQAILDTFLRAGITAELSNDIAIPLWKKFTFISAVGGLTALTRLTLGELLEVDATRSMLSDAMRETDSVARNKGITLEHDHIDTVFESLRKYDNNTRSSLYHDLIHGKPMEVEALSGTVFRYGLATGIPTPIHRTIYASLLPYHLKHMAARNARQQDPPKSNATSPDN